MKVTIEKVSMKNFLSVGNTWITIEFLQGLYRVSGNNLDNNTKNGVGKSSIFVDSLMFALFGKPIRKISLPDIPNTINNKKDCEVKLWFSVEDKKYMIYRGIAPGFLKIYENYQDGDEDLKNNKDEKQDSAKKYTQKRIDDLIGSNYNTLSHLLIMSNTYTSPFLDLDSKKKREIIEDILGVSIFGDLSDKAKDYSLDIKSELKIAEKEFEMSKASISSLEDSMAKLKLKSEEFETVKKEKLSKLKVKLLENKKSLIVNENNLEDIEKLKTDIETLKKDIKVINNDMLSISGDILVAKTTKTNNMKILSELKDKPTCPICNTITDSDHIKNHVDKLKEELKNSLTKINDSKEKISILVNKEDEIDSEIEELNSKIDASKRSLMIIDNLKQEKENLKVEATTIQSEKNNFLDLIDEDELIEKKNSLAKLESDLEELSSKRRHYEYIRKLLSDDGIKNYIIKKILKFWNYKVNFYLKELNAEFSISFDELLNATIKSRNRDPLQYHSFSGGEKARIDVAILLSVIDISKIQNSIDINVMVIDELLDGGLDDNGREDVLHLFQQMSATQNKSIYVISHNVNLPLDLFKEEILLQKKKGFTSLVK